jgi:hypothetical protein
VGRQIVATVPSGGPLTIVGQSDVSQNWGFDDSAGVGTLDGYFYGDPAGTPPSRPARR